MKPIKFIDAFIAIITRGIWFNAEPRGHGPRTPGPQGRPGTKLERLARANAIGLRGRAGKL